MNYKYLFIGFLVITTLFIVMMSYSLYKLSINRDEINRMMSSNLYFSKYNRDPKK